jgi:hypothetical protein
MIAILTMLALAVVLTLIERGRGRTMMSHLKEQMLAAGEVLDIDKLEPPRVPADENCRAELEGLLEEMNGLPEPDPMEPTWQFPTPLRINRPSEGTVAWKQDRFVEEDDIFETSCDYGWGDLKEPIALAEPFLQRLPAILDGKRLDSGIDYRGGFYGDLKIDFYTKIRLLIKRLSTGAMAAMRAGEREKAHRYASRILALVEMTRNERLIISQLLRANFARTATETIWELLADDGWEDAQLRDLQERCESLSFMKPMLAAIEMERAMTFAEFRRLRDSPEYLGKALEMAELMDELLPNGGGVFHTSKAHVALWRLLWSEHDEHNSIAHWKQLVDAFRAAESSWNAPETRRMFDELEEPEGLGGEARLPSEDRSWYERTRFLFSGAISLLNTHALIRRKLQMETLNRLAITALALKRHRLKAGVYPETLAELTPEFLARPMLDPMTGKTLIYRRSAGDVFHLYSAGMNGVDDGGDATQGEGDALDPLWDGKDIVWPAYATVR